MRFFTFYGGLRFFGTIPEKIKALTIGQRTQIVERFEREPQHEDHECLPVNDRHLTAEELVQSAEEQGEFPHLDHCKACRKAVQLVDELLTEEPDVEAALIEVINLARATAN